MTGPGRRSVHAGRGVPVVRLGRGIPVVRVGAVGVALALALAGCGAAGGGTRAAPTATSATASPAASAAPSPVAAAVPPVQPALGANAHLDYFNRVAAAVDPATGGRGDVDALVAAGFDKTLLEVGFDKTSANLDADSVQFSVRFADGCLIGQNGPKSGGYHGLVTPVLATGRCLVGSTRQIDW